MEQMYLIEIFIDKVTVFTSNTDEDISKKNLIIKAKFGPKAQFIIKESQLVVQERAADVISVDEETGKSKYSRIIRTGKSYLFPSYPDTLLMILSKFPLEIEVWNDDDTELINEFIGVGNMHWDTNFFYMLKETRDPCKIHEPLAIKNKTDLMAECCCSKTGEVDFILRLTALGNSIITEFQQQMKDPELFVFRTNKAPSMFQCKRIEGDNPNFCMVGSIFETTTLEDPDIINKAKNKIEVCTELQTCGMGGKDGQFVCYEPSEPSEPKKKKYTIDKIRMGDITGPCGNANCALAHKVRKYIRALDSYKGKAGGIRGEKSQDDKKICGSCVCKDDRWHRDECPAEYEQKIKCSACQGMKKAGTTCKEKKDLHFGTGLTPKTSDTIIGFAFSITKFPDNRQGMFGHDTIVEDCFCTKVKSLINVTNKSTSEDIFQNSAGCSGCSGCRPATSKSVTTVFETVTPMYSIGTNNPMVYNLERNKSRSSHRKVVNSTSTNYTMSYNVGTSSGNQSDLKRIQVYNCSELKEEKDCKCSPHRPVPPCTTFDCDCIAEIENKASRKNHRPYCPSYKHKPTCPVTMMNEEEEKKLDEDEDETTPLPYGLPPIQLGPCPVMGRPCTVPDGFSRMYKNALLPTQPFSYSDDGKVCCSKEYERIKKAIRNYMKNEKHHDYRCVNKFNVDTERRCCDKEQTLMSLMGKQCCGSHKVALHDKHEEEEKKRQRREKPDK